MFGASTPAPSHSEYWDSTVIFVVQDDPQGESEHVDGHRSILEVISPWAKHGHISHVRTGYPSIFRTIEAILDLPPMNREDALATPLWDVFTSVLGDLVRWQRTGVRPETWPEGGPCAAREREGEAEFEDEEEADAYDAEWARFEAWQRAHPGVADHVKRPAGPVRDAD